MRSHIIISCVVLLFAGCIPKESVKPTSLYSIETTQAITTSINGDKIVKIVVVGNSQTNSNDIWYKKSNLMAPYLYSKWAMPLDEMIAQNIANAKFVRDSFGNVALQNSSLKSDFIMEIDVLQMYQEFGEKGSSVRMTLLVNLISNKTKELTRSFVVKKQHACKTDDAAGAVEAYEKIFRDL